MVPCLSKTKPRLGTTIYSPFMRPNPTHQALNLSSTRINIEYAKVINLAFRSATRL